MDHERQNYRLFKSGSSHISFLIPFHIVKQNLDEIWHIGATHSWVVWLCCLLQATTTLEGMHMTALSDIAFWEILNIKVFDSRLQNFLGNLGNLGDRLMKHPAAPALSCGLFLVFVSTCFSVSLRPWCRFRKEDQIHARSALQALLSFLVPTCSLWSIHYIELASGLRSRVDIPLEVIIKDMVDGVIEFRNPIDDLASLVGLGTTVNGHTIHITIDWMWWIDFFEWCMFAEFKSGSSLFGSSRYTSRLSDWLHNDVLPDSTSPTLSLTPFALTWKTSYPLLCLDQLPPGILPSLNTGSKAILEFTAFSPSLRILSTERVVSAIPFIVSNSGRRPRSLVSVLEQLTASYGSNLAIASISNVSADYERALHRVYKSLSEDQTIREEWVETLSIKAWRRDMFLVALETALVRRGWIERWAVQVTVA